MERFNTYTNSSNELNHLKYSDILLSNTNILDDLIQEVNSNKNYILAANKEDLKYHKKQIKIEEFINIINSYKEKDEQMDEFSRKIVVYRGNPYVTLNLCIQAFLTKTQVLLIQENFMIGTNLVLIEIVKKVLKKYEIENLINTENEFSMKNFEQIYQDYDETIIIGNSSLFNYINKKGFENLNLKYFPYNNINLYCSSIEFEKLKKAIFILANEYEYEIEILYSEDIDNVIEKLNLDEEKNIAILLSNDENEKNKFLENVVNKEIYINQNPFKEEVGNIYNYLK
jgi:hypothetical protein